jgi:hypothetical protein
MITRKKRRRAVLGVTLCSVVMAILFQAAMAEPPSRPPFDEQLADFGIRVGGEVIPYRVFALFVLPGEPVRVEIDERTDSGHYRITTPEGTAASVPLEGWGWTAPKETGLYPLTVSHEETGGSLTLNVFVLVPFDRAADGELNGYVIGDYPSRPYKGLAIYEPPAGFVEVTAKNEQTRVSPHFRLGQFVCKQVGDHPKYLVLRERLLLELERLLKGVNEAGYRYDTFHVMSGYRTPSYNSAIRNVQYSRHLWGDAADIFVDENPADEMMDDLNGDGSTDRLDAAVLYDVIDGLHRTQQYAPLVGGLARYGKTAAHGPFVHVDVRGFKARWGK